MAGLARIGRVALPNGREELIQTARHEVFCHFEPGKDPISFGLPDDRGRYRA
jgi:hypothetical protein